MRVSLVITTYNRPCALLLVLQSINNQLTLPFDVVIADDGSNNLTHEVIKKFQATAKFTITHSWQENKGFRVAESRNKAIALSKADYVILIDGDMILHPSFLKDHIKNAENGYFVQGTRAFLTKIMTEEIISKMNFKVSYFLNGILNKENAIHSNLLSNFFVKKKNFLSGIKTCNMAFFKKDCIRVNGFNNEFEGWGREDSEFVVRLLNSGTKRKNIRFNAIQYHLWHSENSRESLAKNDLLLDLAIKNSSAWCKYGIGQYLSKDVNKS